MAVTAMWAVKVRVDNALNYIVNPEKTTAKPELAPEAIEARKAVGDVIDYAVDADKTEKMMYVTGINCNPDTALDEFMETKWRWGKTGGRLAYHGYQAFLEGEGEITAEKAHAIGVQLAKELWGDRFEVVVATHLNTGHYHNHLLVNSVSFLDGYKYRRTKADYRKMRIVNDRLCREAKLHVVDESSPQRGLSYEEWLTKRNGKLTVRDTIREDIDYAIRLSRSEKEFATTMKELGYDFKFFKEDGSLLAHPGLKPPGAKGYFRFRGLGPDYDYDAIRRRIVANTLVPNTPYLIENEDKYVNKQPNETGLSYSYRRYCVRLYSFVCQPKGTRRGRIPMALREDIRKLDHYIEQLDFICKHKFEDKYSIETKKELLRSELKNLLIQRRRLNTEKERAIRHQDGTQIAIKTSEITNISKRIRELRKEIKMCDELFISADKVVQLAYGHPIQHEKDVPKPKPVTLEQRKK